MEKNKGLQSSVTGLKLKNSELSTQVGHLAAENEKLTRALRDQRDLVTKLEKDLADVNNVSALCRGEGEGQPAPSFAASEWVLEAVSDLGESL
jgi:septal ring factor EnvC (AmiA/AmiB activator)